MRSWVSMAYHSGFGVLVRNVRYPCRRSPQHPGGLLALLYIHLHDIRGRRGVQINVR